MHFKYTVLGFIFLFSFQTLASDLIYFDTYEQNRKAFLEQSEGNSHQSWPLIEDASLTTDLTFIQAPKQHEQMIVFSSGLHGIEGYVGSSLQRWLLNRLRQKKDLKSDVLFVHALNPWGMKNKRRVNEHNIDLNRHFSADAKIYSEKNEDYVKINYFLNRTEKLELTAWHRFTFILTSLQLILKTGLETLRKAILIGQYSEPLGLYYGGNRASPLQSRIDQLFKNELKKYKKILWIDLHTGYGETGRLHLLANNSESPASKNLQKVFANTKIDFGNEKKFYQTKGDLVQYLSLKSTPEQTVQAIVFEYGTLDSQKTLGSIESLRRMVIENQGFHHQYVDADSEQGVKKLFQEMFFPQDEKWKNSIQEQTEKIVNTLFE